MKSFYIREIGKSQINEIEAQNKYEAIQEIANCKFTDVGIPIWKERDTECFMPYDGSGRQWVLVEKF